MRVRRFAAAVAATAAAAGFAAAVSATSPANAAAPTTPGAFVGLTPATVLDTGAGIGAPKAAVPAHGTVTFAVAGAGGVPASGASAVTLVVGVANPAASGFATTYAAGTTRPGAASLNFTVHQTIANLIVVSLGTTGTNAGKVTIYNGSSAAQRFVANVTGYYVAGTPTASGAFAAVTPANVLDTGTGVGAPKGTVAPQTSVTFKVTGTAGVPTTGVGAVALVVAAVTPQSPGYATVYAGGTPRPAAAALDFVPNQSIANLTITAIGSAGTVSIFNGSSTPIRLVANIFGYFQAGSPIAAGTFAPVAEANLLDTGRGIGGPAVNVPAHGTVNVQVTGRGGVPYNAGAASLTIAAASPTTSGYVTVYPTGVALPGAASLDFTSGQSATDLSTMRLGDGGRVTLFNGSSAAVRMVVNVSGYWLGSDDVLPPAPVSGLVASGAGPTSVRLFWHNPTDRDFAGVKICHRTDAPAPPTCTSIAGALVTATSYTETSLTAGTQYDYEVFAVDAAGNVSSGVSTSGTTQPTQTPNATGAIAGTVRDTASTPHPMADVLVQAFPVAASSGPALQAVTAADGTYTLVGVPAAAVVGSQYRVCFDASYATGGNSSTGYQDRCFPNVAWPRPDLGAPAAATKVVVKRNVTTSKVDGLLYPASQISGTITDATSGAVVSNVRVSAFSVDDPTFATSTAIAGNDGTYLLRNVAPTAHGYYVCFDATLAAGGFSTTGYVDQCYKNAAWNSLSATPSGDAVVVGAPGGASGVDAALTRGGAIAGTVTASATGVAGVDVLVTDATGAELASATTDATGAYRVTGLAAGTDTVCFNTVDAVGAPAHGYAAQCYSGKAWDGNTLPPPASTPVPVASGATTPSIDAALTANP